MRLCPNVMLRLLAGAVAGFATFSLSGGPASAAEPIVLSIIDTGGDLASTQVIIENYKKANPDKVKEIKIQRAPAPELPAKIKAQQDAGRLDINLVLTGQDGGAFLAANNQLIKIPDFEKIFPRDDMTPAGKALYDEGKPYMIPAVGNAGGPVFVYNPSKVPNPPKTADELLAWAKANPGKLMYARPANSGPGRSIVQGMAFILGESKPLDPEKGWDKTWAYLKELDETIEYYPSGTGVTMKELGEGSRDMIASTTGWDINPRVLGIVPTEAKVFALDGMHWVADAHYMCVPRGVSDEKLGVLLDLISYLLTPKSQAFAYDKGYFYPGPAVKDVPLSMAPQASQDALKEFGRPEYEAMIAAHPIETPLAADAMVVAFKLWDERIGGAKRR
jgi:putative spermidine/putrescine transport system substrate-binding protein